MVDKISLKCCYPVFTQLHYLFNVAHYMRLIVQREGGLDLLKVRTSANEYINYHILNCGERDNMKT